MYIFMNVLSREVFYIVSCLEHFFDVISATSRPLDSRHLTVDLDSISYRVYKLNH